MKRLRVYTQTAAMILIMIGVATLIAWAFGVSFQSVMIGLLAGEVCQHRVEHAAGEL